MNAKYYIYRNLNKGGFSVKYRGKVIKIIQNAALSDVEFRVSLAGRERALDTKVRNVHAYIVCKHEPVDMPPAGFMPPMMEITYNPFKGDSFFVPALNYKTIRRANLVYLTNGRAYI